jgi:prolyl-tRNA editing enzyme YbaK/EbsC (Cys-tRNA(Pro) deacylase)
MDAKLTRVVDAGRRLGIVVDPVTFSAQTRTAADAAREVGCEVGQIVKSLVFDSDEGPILLLVSGANRVDPALAAAAAGTSRVVKADAARVKEATGFSIGATPPFGHDTELAVFMDEDLLGYESVWAAAGRPDSVFEVDPHDLARATAAQPCALKEATSASS